MKVSKFALAFLIWVFSSTSAAPPAHAPAHGYRNKTGTAAQPFDIRCNARSKSAGDHIGDSIKEGLGGTLGNIAGAAGGALIDDMLDNQDDRWNTSCADNILDKLNQGTPVRWYDADADQYYYFQPGKTFKNKQGQACREFTSYVGQDATSKGVLQSACNVSADHWKPFD